MAHAEMTEADRKHQLESVLNSLFENFLPLKYSSKHSDKMDYDSFLRYLNQIAEYHGLPRVKESVDGNGAKSQMTLCALYDTIAYDLPLLIGKTGEYRVRLLMSAYLNLLRSHEIIIIGHHPYLPSWRWDDKDDRLVSLFALETALIEDGSLPNTTRLG